MHYMDANKTAGEETRWQLHKNAACNPQQVLAATPTRHQLYGHLPPITKSIQVRRTRHAGHCWRSRDELIRDVLLWIPTHGRAKAGRPARTYIQQLCEDTGCCPEDLPRRWTIGRSGERGSGISVLPARYDDDDDDGKIALKIEILLNVRWFVLYAYMIIWLFFNFFKNTGVYKWHFFNFHNKPQIENATGEWMTSCPEAMGWEFGYFEKKSVGDKMPNWEPAADRGLWAFSNPRLSNQAKMRKKCCYGRKKNFGSK